MNPISVTLLLCALANLALTAWVFWRRHPRAVHYAFASVVLAIAGWNLATFVVALADDLDALHLAGQTAFASGAVLLACFVVFTWYFPERHNTRPSRPVAVAGAIVTGLVIILSYTRLFQAGVVIGPQGKQRVDGGLYLLYVAYMLGCFGWGSWNLLRSRVHTPSGRERMQLNYVFAAFALAIFLAFAGNFVLVHLPASTDHSLLIGAWSSLMWAVLTAYAILRHRLMDIGVALRNVLTHGALAVMILVLVILPFVLHYWILRDAPMPTQIILIGVVTGLLSTVLPGLHRRLVWFVDHRIFHGRYDHETALLRFGERLQGTYGHANIAETVAGEVAIIMQAESDAVYLPQYGKTTGESYLLTAGFHLDTLAQPSNLDKTHPLMHELARRQTRLVTEDVMNALSPGDTRQQEVAAALNKMGVVVAVPLVNQGRFLGALLLGEKKYDNVYTSDELRLLSSIAAQIAFALDNTRLYEEVLQAKRQYETILSHMQRGVLAADVNLQIIALNATGAEILGVSTAECQGCSLNDIVPAFAEVLAKTVTSRRNLRPVEMTLDLNGRTIPCQCETSIMLDARNAVVGGLIVFQDMTEQQRFNRQVRRMDRLASVGTLAAGIAHEIKNPLVSIKTFAQLLPERYEEMDFRNNFGNVVLSEIDRINRLVHNLLGFARPRHVQAGPVQVHDLVDRALTLLENEFKKKNVEVSCEYGDDVPVIIADPEQLYQVVFNLLQNAAQAIDASSGRVTISTKKSTLDTRQVSKEVVLLSIQDTGSGIEKKDVASIFDPFFSTKADGSGLGLSICHNILKEHGATIDVESAPGKGSVFTITLPVQPDGQFAQGVEVG